MSWVSYPYKNCTPLPCRLSLPGSPALEEPRVRVVASLAVVGVAVMLAGPVSLWAAERPVSFVNDVEPILAKAGCNSGACHGAAAGKNGFKISLFGYDPAGDHRALTRDMLARRMDLADPEKSLILLKPTGQLAHEGGKRFAVGSGYYETLVRWIREGARSDVETAARLVKIEVAPEYQVFAKPGGVQPLRVTARYGDGSSREVAGDARYVSNNEMAAEVDERGVVKLARRGEAAIMVRYGDKIAVSRVVVLDPASDFAWNNPPAENYIDPLVFAKLRDMHIVPSELSTDGEFLRRVWLDVAGVPPAAEEVRRFLADKDPKKRARKIDELLDRPEYAEVWALKWADLLGIRSEDPGVIATALTPREVWKYYRWIRESFAANKPYDEFVRELVTAGGRTSTNAPAMYYRRYRDATELTENTTQLFLGIRLKCARCHDHPFEKWVQNDYYGMAAFFSQVKLKPGGGFRDFAIYADAVAPQSEQPTRKVMLGPRALGAGAVAVGAEEDARRKLAEWLTSAGNPWFARAFVNRVWSYYFGRGIIEPVDDLRASNPASNDKLLDALTRDFVEHRFDVKHLVRTILNSRTYQLSSRTNRWNADDAANFSHQAVRRLTAEQVVDALAQATGVPEDFTTNVGDPGKPKIDFPAGYWVRAGQIPDAKVRSYMLTIFGRPQRDDPCECERHQEVSMTQALHLINGDSVDRRLNHPKGWLAQTVGQVKDDGQLAEAVYLQALSRLPNEEELALGRKALAGQAERLRAAQDLMWALVNSREFLFNY